ncbi:MAG: hypothetical protein R3200_11255, partial [Xanthomonadales bacterium]|nr:hypothetical protein [Xanthomonadales bacterium]
ERLDPVQAMTLVHLARNDATAFRETVLRSGPLQWPNATYLAWAGMDEWVADLVNQIDSQPWGETSKAIAEQAMRGTANLYGGDPERALQQLSGSLELIQSAHAFSLSYGSLLVAVEQKAQAQLALGDRNGALQTLAISEEIKDTMQYFSPPAIVIWRRCQELRKAIQAREPVLADASEAGTSIPP